jgi:hypothetical protein
VRTPARVAGSRAYLTTSPAVVVRPATLTVANRISRVEDRFLLRRERHVADPRTRRADRRVDDRGDRFQGQTLLPPEPASQFARF